MKTTEQDALIPNQLSTDTQFNRFHHLDIEYLEDSDLQDEFYALRPILWGLPSDHWLRERVEVLETEMIRRRGNTDHELKVRPKPKLAERVEL